MVHRLASQAIFNPLMSLLNVCKNINASVTSWVGGGGGERSLNIYDMPE